MAKKKTDSTHVSPRRDFFRLLISEAVEGLEKVGKEIVERRFGHFRQPPAPAYTPPPDYNRFIAPQYKIYGPPWPPPFGPYVTPELRRKLDAAQNVRREEYGHAVPRD